MRSRRVVRTAQMRRARTSIGLQTTMRRDLTSKVADGRVSRATEDDANGKRPARHHRNALPPIKTIKGTLCDRQARRHHRPDQRHHCRAGRQIRQSEVVYTITGEDSYQAPLDSHDRV